MKKGAEIREDISNIAATLNQLSTDISRPINLDDGLSISYLDGKFTEITNLVNHIKGQLKFLKKHG